MEGTFIASNINTVAKYLLENVSEVRFWTSSTYLRPSEIHNFFYTLIPSTFYYGTFKVWMHTIKLNCCCFFVTKSHLFCQCLISHIFLVLFDCPLAHFIKASVINSALTFESFVLRTNFGQLTNTFTLNFFSEMFTEDIVTRKNAIRVVSKKNKFKSMASET